MAEFCTRLALPRPVEVRGPTHEARDTSDRDQACEQPGGGPLLGQVHSGVGGENLDESGCILFAVSGVKGSLDG